MIVIQRHGPAHCVPVGESRPAIAVDDVILPGRVDRGCRGSATSTDFESSIDAHVIGHDTVLTTHHQEDAAGRRGVVNDYIIPGRAVIAFDRDGGLKVPLRPGIAAQHQSFVPGGIRQMNDVIVYLDIPGSPFRRDRAAPGIRPIQEVVAQDRPDVIEGFQ